MQKAKLLNSIQPLPAPERKSDKVIAKAQEVEDGEEKRILAVDLFYKGKLEGRYFNDGKTFWSYVKGEWTNCKISNVARKCKNLSAWIGPEQWSIRTEWEWDSSQDKMICYDCLGYIDLEELEYDIGRKKYLQMLCKKEKKIDEIMAGVPEVPKDMQDWVEKEIFPEHYLFVRKVGKGQAFCCTNCLRQGKTKTKQWKTNETTKCPFCGKEVTVRTRTKYKEKRKPVVIIQSMKNKGEWVERQFRAVAFWDTLVGKKIMLLEDVRAVMPNWRQWGTLYYGQTYEAAEDTQVFWTGNALQKRFVPSLLYPGNIKEIQKQMGMLNTGIDILASKGITFHVNKFIVNFRSQLWMEYLIKAGLTNLAADITKEAYATPTEINGEGMTLKELLKIDGNRVARAKELNISLNGLEWLQYEQIMQEKGKKIKVTNDSLKYLSERKVPRYKCRAVLAEVKSVNKMVNYLKKQKGSPSRTLETWADYLSMARQEGYDVRDDIVKFPRDLKGRHDELVERINARNDEQRAAAKIAKYARIDEAMKQHIPNAKRYEYENREYKLIAATKCEDLIKESQQLHHCVGTSDIYMNRMADGETWILLLRKKEDTSKAYYTIEVDMADDEILQYYSEWDRQPDLQKIRPFLKEYKRFLKKRWERSA